MNKEIWKKVKTIKSDNVNVLKYVFEKDDALVEAVLYKYPTYEERTVMCISVMCGCPMRCGFCGTGEFYARNLTSEEIVDQVEYMIKDNNLPTADIKNWQIMTMSMGEPLLTQKELIPALRTLNQSYPHAKLLISTAGPKTDYTPFMELCGELDVIGLQFSVHESTDAARNKLVRTKGKLSLSEMVTKGEEFFQYTGRHPFFNYCVHEGNNSQEDVQRLLDLGFDPKVWQSTLSVICEKDINKLEEWDEEFEECITTEFSKKMQKVGFSTRVFNPAGASDISGAGCGQLLQVSQWARENPDKVTIFNNKGVIPAPTRTDAKNNIEITNLTGWQINKIEKA